MKHGLPRLLAIAVLLVVAVVAGCGGSGTAVATSAQPTEAPAAESSGSDDAGSGAGGQPSTEPPIAAPASEAPAGGGGTAAGVCELVTADELSGIFGVPSVTMTVLPGPPDNCIVEDDSGDALTAWSLTTAQAATVYGAFTTDPATIQVSGIGDKAAIVENTGLLVLKGGALVVVMISSGADMTEEEAIEASKQVGALAAGRL
jgi:hypothetical protein